MLPSPLKDADRDQPAQHQACNTRTTKLERRGSPTRIFVQGVKLKNFFMGEEGRNCMTPRKAIPRGPTKAHV